MGKQIYEVRNSAWFTPYCYPEVVVETDRGQAPSLLKTATFELIGTGLLVCVKDMTKRVNFSLMDININIYYNTNNDILTSPNHALDAGRELVNLSIRCCIHRQKRLAFVLYKPKTKLCV